jgi:hypothetical protein
LPKDRYVGAAEGGKVMDVRKHFQSVVEPNYNDFVQRPTEYRYLENTLCSGNTVAERLGLDQLEYAEVGRGVLTQEAQGIRKQSSSLEDLKFCADTLKHGRKIIDHGDGKFTTIATSTGIDPANPSTWKIYRRDLGITYDLASVAHNAIPTLRERLELK